jgi:dienelactone hydrolase
MNQSSSFIQQKPSVLIISDMFGLKDEYAKDDSYVFRTADIFEKLGFITRIYSSIKLAKISTKNNLANLHDLFISNGIDHAIESLSHAEFDFDIGIGFSVGGVILWNGYQKEKLRLKKLICISSTRLRNEVKKMDIPTITIFGENDHYAPTLEKMKSLNAVFEIVPGSDHEFYRNIEVLSHVLHGNRMLSFIKTVL